MKVVENENEADVRSVQIMFKMPSVFMERFDRITEAFGYTRTEAVREAMRRFQSELEADLSERPEEASKAMQSIFEGFLAPLVKMGQQAKPEQPAIGPIAKK